MQYINNEGKVAYMSDSEYQALPLCTDDTVLPELEDPDNWKERDPLWYRSMQEIVAQRRGLVRLQSAREFIAELNAEYGIEDEDFEEEEED